jgi:hypothetical protein
VRTDLRLPQLPMGISWLPACPPPRILACRCRRPGRVEPGWADPRPPALSRWRRLVAPLSPPTPSRSSRPPLCRQAQAYALGGWLSLRRLRPRALSFPVTAGRAYDSLGRCSLHGEPPCSCGCHPSATAPQAASTPSPTLPAKGCQRLRESQFDCGLARRAGYLPLMLLSGGASCLVL